MALIDSASVVLGDEYDGEYSVKVDLSKGYAGERIMLKNIDGSTFANLDAVDARTLAAILLGMADALDAN